MDTQTIGQSDKRKGYWTLRYRVGESWRYCVSGGGKTEHGNGSGKAEVTRLPEEAAPFGSEAEALDVLGEFSGYIMPEIEPHFFELEPAAALGIALAALRKVVTAKDERGRLEHYWQNAAAKCAEAALAKLAGFLAAVPLTASAVTWTAWDFVAIAIWLAGLYFACGRMFYWSRRTKWTELRRAWIPQARPMQMDCAWCGQTLRSGRQPVSHGICEQCRDTLIEGDAPQPDRVQLN